MPVFFTRICALERLDELVTAEDVDPARARGLAAAGLRVSDCRRLTSAALPAAQTAAQ
jgi:hypothetical protein